MSLHGRCNCDAVRIVLRERSSGGAYQTIYCRCTTCKRASGAGGMYVAIVDEEHIEVDDPSEVRRMWKDTSTDSGNLVKRWSCGTCASPLFAVSPNRPGKVIVRMGLFDHVPPVVMEVYMKRRQEWEPVIEGAFSIEGAPR